MVCNLLHCLAWSHNRGAPLRSYIPYYNIDVTMDCAAPGRYGGIWYALEALRRCDTLQRGADSVISAFVGLVSWAAEWVKPQEKPL